jgi:hypothetical protein
VEQTGYHVVVEPDPEARPSVTSSCDEEAATSTAASDQYSSGALTVPDHAELKTGPLRALIRDAGMSIEELVEALRR